MMKRLYRSDQNKTLFGIIGGLGEYLDVDPSVLRLAWLVLVVFTGFVPGIIVYFLSVLIVPKRLQT